MKYLCIICAEKVMEQLDEDDAKRHFEDYARFTEDIRRSGHLLDCNRLLPADAAATVRVRDGRMSTTDGPFAETKEVIGGYAILEAPSMQEALELTKRFLRIHGNEWDIECEVRQLDGPELG
jgi:hypothetical protein